MNNLRIGDLVKFNINYKEMFIKETTGIDEMGEIDEFIGNICNVKFSDGWKLPIPTKYLTLVANPN